MIEVIPGRDSQNRIFVSKTKNGLLKRPLQRIYPLEIEQREDIVKNVGISERIFKKPSAKIKHCNIKREESDSKTVTTRSRRVNKKPHRFKY